MEEYQIISLRYTQITVVRSSISGAITFSKEPFFLIEKSTVESVKNGEGTAVVNSSHAPRI